jgi:hypothetical protein
VTRFFGYHAVDEHGQLRSLNKEFDHAPSSSFPPALLEENRATIERMKAERKRKP